jgi:YD repeat-containing protein
MTGIVDERGVRINTWVYDANGKVIVAEGAPGADRYTFAYDATARTTTVTNPLGKDTVYHFSPNSENQNLLVHIEGLPSSHCVGADSYLTYDANDYVTQITDAEGRVRNLTNDGRGRPTTIVDAPSTPLQRTVNISWDATFAIPTVVHQPGLDTSFAIDPSTGRISSVTQTDQTTQTVPYSTNGETRTWSFTYDTAGNLLTVVGPLPGGGDTVTYTYNANGYLGDQPARPGHDGQQRQRTRPTDPDYRSERHRHQSRL